MCECVENKIKQEVNEIMKPYKQEKDNLIQIFKKNMDIFLRLHKWKYLNI